MALRNGADNFDLNFSFAFNLILQAVDDDGRIDNRFGIGHGGDAGNAAGSRCLSPRFDRFLARLAGLTEMDVHIDEARCYDETRSIENFFGIVGCKISTDFFNFSIFNEDITNFILLHGRIDHSAAFNE